MKLYSGNKKSLYALCVLGLAAVYMVYSQFFSGPTYKPVTPQTVAAPHSDDSADASGSTPAPAPKGSGPDVSQAKGRVSKGGSSKGKNGEFHPVYIAKKAEERPDIAQCRSDDSLRSAGANAESAAGRLRSRSFPDFENAASQGDGACHGERDNREALSIRRAPRASSATAATGTAATAAAPDSPVQILRDVRRPSRRQAHRVLHHSGCNSRLGRDLHGGRRQRS